MRAGINFLSRGGSWYEWYTTTKPAQHPTLWRFVVYGNFRGTPDLNLPSTSTWTSGWGVFDWHDTNNRYELTSFSPAPYGYEGHWGAYAWVNDTDVRIIGTAIYDSSADTIRHAAKISVSPGGVISFVEPGSTHCGDDLVNMATFYQGFGVGYDGAALYAYADGNPTPPSSNCFIGKITSTNSATNLGPLRTGLTQGAQFAPLAPLGATAAGNGYAVCVKNCYEDFYASSMQTGLVDIGAATPALVANCTYTGRPNTWAPLHLGARKVLVNDYHDSSYNGKCSLLYTNSDTAPTTLTQGSTVFAPTMPFRAADVEFAYPGAGGFNATNMWVSEGKSAGLVIYKLDQNLEAGETERYYYLPCKYTSSATSDLAIALLSVDADGVALPVDTWWNSTLQNIDNYAFCFVGAPDDRVALFWRLGSAASGLNQTIMQL